MSKFYLMEKYQRLCAKYDDLTHDIDVHLLHDNTGAWSEALDTRRELAVEMSKVRKELIDIAIAERKSLKMYIFINNNQPKSWRE